MAKQLIGTNGDEFYKHPYKIAWGFYCRDNMKNENTNYSEKTNYINRYGKNVEANKIYYVKDNPILDRLLTILKKRYSDIEYRGIVINKKVYPNIVKRNENYCKNIFTKYLKC